MADKREAILVRLLAIAGGIEGINEAVRNDPVSDDAALPLIQILDGEMSPHEGDPPTDGRARGAVPYRMVMAPEIYIMVDEASENVGTTLNTLLARLARDVSNDATLQGLTGPNGIRLLRCTPDFDRGRETQGWMRVVFSFTYLFNVADLAGL